jgi:hypothetical protein
MAQRMVFQYFDDLDGKPLDVEDLQAVEWSWAGVNYHFDTSTANLDLIEAGSISVATLLAKSKRTTKPQRSTSKDRHIAAPESGDSSVVPDLAHCREVREWAIANYHHGVGKRGRLSKTVVEAYKLAHNIR